MNESIRNLIDRSSLGTPGARSLRARTPEADAAAVVQMSREDEILAQLDSGLAVVVRLPPFRKPYSAFLKWLSAEGRLVRIGRPSKWGNPIPLPPRADEVDRAQVIAAYGRHLDASPDLLAALTELRGKALGCYCWPLACHGDLLAARVNALLPPAGDRG